MSKPVTTKSDLLAYMASLNACGEATAWVESRPEALAVDIFAACGNVDWLIWLGGRRSPAAIADFAQRCATRHPAAAAHAAEYAIQLRELHTMSGVKS